MKFAIVFLTLLFVVVKANSEEDVMYVEDNEIQGRNLGRKKKSPRAVKNCPKSRKCSKYGGFPSIEAECSKYDGYYFVSNDDFGNKQLKNKICGCCIPKGKQNSISSITGEYFQLESTHIGASSSTTDFSEDTNRISMNVDESASGMPILSSLNLLAQDDNQNVWSFHAAPRSETPIECDGERCKATVKGHASSKLLDELAPEIPNEKDHLFLGTIVSALVDIEFDDPTNDSRLKDFIANRNVEDSFQSQGFVAANIIIRAGEKASSLKDINLSLDLTRFSIFKWIPIGPIIIYPPIVLQERKRNLCLQPVRVRQRDCKFKIFGICFMPTYTYSGDGLAYGKPKANELWEQVDITFTWKDWKTINDNAGKYKAVTEAEMSDLRSEITDDPCCIEIFFVDSFSPSDLYGGGATFSSGTANAQIVSSDENLLNPNERHLAHEALHVLGLGHPGSSSSLTPGSTGTVACPSGFYADNPDVQSVENGLNAANPLLISYLGSWTFSTPACTDSSDCGSC
jgi:hypothetical protein